MERFFAPAIVYQIGPVSAALRGGDEDNNLIARQTRFMNQVDRDIASAQPPRPFISGGGKLGKLIADLDWSQTRLGPIAQWPQELRTVVDMLVRSPLAIVLLWGEEGVMIYNDAYAVIAGDRHPHILGRGVLESWPEAADFNAEVLREGLAGKTLQFRDIELMLERNGSPERTWFDLDYSPILDESGRPAGVIAFVVETTAKMLAKREIAHERKRLKTMFEQAPSFMAMLSGPEHVFEFANASYSDFVGNRQLTGKTVREAFPDIEGQGFYELLDQVFETGEPFVGTGVRAEIQNTAGGPYEEVFVDFIYQPLSDAEGAITGILIEGVDVTSRHKGETVRTAQRRALELTVADAPLTEVLSMLLQTAEETSEHGMIGSILLMDDDGQHLRHGAAPKLPKEYNAAVDGIAIGPKAGSCGTAAYRKRPVYVTDIETDPLWDDFRDLAREHGLRACWSTPILSSQEDVLGTFAVYYRKPHRPSLADEQLIEVITRTAALVIEGNRAEEQLRESEQRFRTIVKQAKDAIFVLDPDNNRILEANPAAVELFEYSSREELLAAPLTDFHPHNLTDFKNFLESVRKQGSGSTDKFRCTTKKRNLVISEITASNLVMNGQSYLLAVVRDISERKHAEDHRQMLLDELNHRVKNTLATVQAIATQTLRGQYTDPEEARLIFESRLFALASAHSLLTREQWEGVELAALAELVLKPYKGSNANGQRVHIAGPHIHLTPKSALALSMAFHELASNAAKYGALSDHEGGQVSLTWQELADTGRLRLEWREQNGPPVSPPQRKGFGSRLIMRGLAHELNGEVNLTFPVSGVSCTIEIPKPERKKDHVG